MAERKGVLYPPPRIAALDSSLHDIPASVLESLFLFYYYSH